MIWLAIWLTGFVVFGWTTWMNDEFGYYAEEDFWIVLMCSFFWPFFLFYCTITHDRRISSKGR